MSASEMVSPGGQPSTTAPIAGPWDSPQVVKRKTRPKVLKLMSGQRDIRRVLGLHADHVIAGIDVMRFAGHAAREIAQQVQAGAADILDRDVALQRRVE